MLRLRLLRNKTNPSAIVFTTEFAFNPMNFRRVPKQAKWCEAQLQLFAKQFASTVDKRIKVALEPLQALPDRIDELKNHSNTWLREMSSLDLAKLRSALDKEEALRARFVGTSTSRPPTTARPDVSEWREAPDGDKAVEDASVGSGTHDSHA
ncbi:hypothetical protein FXO37_04365 [Capsicum annuum]|nr:hypothetical protein FXO37_04365 [Capsicum annuum]